MDLKKLYRTVIMDHYQDPRHKGLTGLPQLRLRNPSCGDDITIEAEVTDHKLTHVHHDGTGCSICCASASIMCDLLTNKTLAEAKVISDNYYQMITNQPYDPDFLGDALAFSDIYKYPARTKCAIIAWEALRELVGINNDNEK